jgi:hypothetical protein
MKTLTLKKTLSTLLATLFILTSQASANAKYFETSDYSVIHDEVAAQAAKYGKDRVLVVFDVDNTLLANTSDLGTDQWFEWQRELLKENDHEYAVARDFDGLVRVQNMIYAVGTMRETEEKVSDVVSDIQESGLSTIVLTARNLDSRDATVRELNANSLDFRNTAVGGLGFAGSFVPYDAKNPSASGLSAEELAAWGLQAARPVTYMDGVFMVAGQHKGAMLRALLHKTNREFSAIVFVDDKAKNNSHMQQGFQGTSVELTAIRYSREDANVARFNTGTKAGVKKQWARFSEALSSVFGK